MNRPDGLARRARIGLAVIAAGTVLAACGTTPTSSSSQKESPAAAGVGATSHTATTPPGGQVVTTIDGSIVHVPSSKPSVLVFISISCADCSAAAKAVAQASRTAGPQATFLGVDLDPGMPAQGLERFLDYADAKDLPVMIDAKAALVAEYKVTALSTVIVLDPGGKVIFRAVNPTAGAILAAVGASS